MGDESRNISPHRGNEQSIIGPTEPITNNLEGFHDIPLYHIPYRAYMETAPQYVPGKGISRYMSALKNLIPIRRSSPAKKSLPVDNAGLFSFIFYTWLSPFIYKSYRKGLTMDDIPQGSPFDACDPNSQRLELLWQEEVARKGISAASFGSTVWKFIRTRILISCLIFSLSLVLGFVSPTIFMRKLLQFAEDENGNVWEGIVWAVCVMCAELLKLVCFAWNWAVSYRTGIRLRSACLTLLYRKAIRMNTLGDKSIGELINIFGNDSQRIFDMVLFGPLIIGGPLVTVFGVCYIYWLLGGWALFGMATFLLFYPTQYGISRLTSYLRSKVIVASDKRVVLMTEILNGIKFIKMYAWEKYFSASVQDIRNDERKLLQKTSYCQSFSMSLASTVPVISAIVTFLAHIVAGNDLSPAQAFPLIVFMRQQAGLSLILVFESGLRILEGFIGLHRFQQILITEDVTPYITRPIDKTEAVRIVDAMFAYDVTPSLSLNIKKRKSASRNEPEREKLTEQTTDRKIVCVLHNIFFNAPKGKLIGVCGPVGAGKTSLILACLGQIKKTAGQVMREGSCAYVSQEAWILNATLRENILFGESFDSKRYYEAIYACCLGDDINMLPGGDQTEIGERGINLSGGQKQRVALARALYANRDIYFLDDPLSAVDAHVGATIFQRYILTALKDKTVVFVTHQIQYLNACHEIYLLKNGYIIENGSHEILMTKDGEYANMVKACVLETDHSSLILQKSSEPVNSEGYNEISCEPSFGDNKVSYSKLSEGNFNEKGRNGKDQLIIAEIVEQGNVTYNTYYTYIAAAGGYSIVFLVCIIFFINVGSSAFSSWWLATWLKESEGPVIHTENNQTVKNIRLSDNPDYYLYRTVYAVSVAVILGTSLLRGFTFTKATLHASTKLHNKLFDKIIHSPMQFFETTPVGRIQNLFSKDMDEVDARLPVTVESIIQNILIVLFAILLICLVFPWFIIPMVLLAFIYYLLSKIFRVAVRDLKRLENVSRSPIFSWVGTTVQGLCTIHAFEKENEFIRRFTHMFDENSTCLYLCCIAGRWLAIRADILAVAVTCITAFLIILLHGQVPPAMAGLALAYSAHITGVFQYTIRLISDTEVRFISVERLNSYIENLVCESTDDPIKTPVGWPNKGTIVFQNVCLVYRRGLPEVLKNVSFSIDAGEKIGIVGRTGSGKSSLIVALFRLVELSKGKIKIDGINIAHVCLDNLRSNLTVIPQDPVLFAGTIRSNIDPTKSFSDAEMWNALEKTRLKEKILHTEGQLEAVVHQGGDNFSVGERQLLCLARALLKNAKVLVLDEATAAVDPETEAVIQMTIQNEFKNSTVLTIAHRLTTVTSANRVLVMDHGEVAEFDTPSSLLSNKNSLFYQLCYAAETSIHQTFHVTST